MHKELLKLVWSKRLYDGKKLETIDGLPVSVIEHGQYDTGFGKEAGGNITGALIEIDGTRYRGNIAAGVKASDIKNDRSESPDNVILLIVSEADTLVCRTDGSPIPTVELKYDDGINARYRQLTDNSREYGGCAGLFGEYKPIERYAYLTRLTIERLERKYNDFKLLYTEANNSWHEAFYVTLFATMGAVTNKEAYIKLAKTVPYNILCRLKDSVTDMEALLLGGSGLLFAQYPDEYVSGLMKRFEELSKPLNIVPMHANEWDLTANKPHHHPVIRIVELAALFSARELLFAQLMKCETPEQAGKIMTVDASPYWDTHFIPGSRSSTGSAKRFGRIMINNIVINLVVPMLATYGKICAEGEMFDKAVEMLEKVPAERNRYTVGWEDGGIELDSAFFSQGLLQLSREYCEKKRCTECNIGEKLLCS